MDKVYQKGQEKPKGQQTNQTNRQWTSSPHHSLNSAVDPGQLSNQQKNQPPRMESMLLHTTGLLQMPAVQVGLLPRTGSPQVQLPATQTSSFHVSPMSGPLFTEDRLNTSGSDQDMCD